MVGDFVFVLFYGGVLIAMGVFARWMLSWEESSNIKQGIDSSMQTYEEEKTL